MMRRNLTAIVAQDLLSRLCHECRIALPDGTFRANDDGCAVCNHQGYSGLIAISELALRRDDADGRPTWFLQTSLEDEALRAVELGYTDVTQVERMFGYVPERKNDKPRFHAA
jgi:type II secretory ATPase GspE/PulE/Tfp pilus assembly ATPase PilB-like protein